VDGFQLLTAFPLARSVTGTPGGVNNRYAQSFVQTSARSWAETDIAGLLAKGQVKFEEAKGDKRGPVSIAAAVSAPATAAQGAAGKEKKEEQKPETRVAVFGDSDFAANFALGIQGNGDLFMNTVNWLSQQENLIAIRPKESADRRLTMTSSQQLRVTAGARVLYRNTTFVDRNGQSPVDSR
jgi:succinate dehydrogenase/fumarate reductase flavoprotein subunit